MSSYTIRVELRGTPSAAVYDILHARLATIGCKRFIVGTDRSGIQRTYSMPHAEYDLTTEFSFDQVRDATLEIAQAVWPHVDVLVSEVINRAWYMDPVQVAPTGLLGLAAAFR